LVVSEIADWVIMTSRSIRFAIAIRLALLLSSPAAAEPLSFGVLTAPPYGLEGADKSVSGFYHDIAELIGAKADLTFTYRLEPLPRLVSDLKAGGLDLMIMFPGADMEQFALIEVMRNNIIVLSRKGAALSQYADLKGKTIATLRGGVYDRNFSNDEGIKKYNVDSYAVGLRMTRGGRVDGMIGPDLGLYYQIGIEGMQRDEFGPPLVLNTRTGFLLASKTIKPELSAKLKAAVEELRNSGAIAAAEAKYAN
jgi:polar amino acid transport system substrate-binding protein